jgi:hypothetical protein
MQEWMLEEWASVEIAYHTTGMVFFVSFYCINNLITIHIDSNANLVYQSYLGRCVIASKTCPDKI